LILMKISSKQVNISRYFSFNTVWIS